MLKIAVFAPMPNARASIATAATPGFFRSRRKPKRVSRRKFAMLALSFSGSGNQTSPGKGCDSSDCSNPTNPAHAHAAPRLSRERANPTSHHHFLREKSGCPPLALSVFRPTTVHSTKCYNLRIMYARKLHADLVIGKERRLAPLDWLDSFCMRNFTGSAEFDDTLPTAEGRLEVGLAVDPARLALAMSEWFTKRGKGNGQAVTIELRELDPPN